MPRRVAVTGATGFLGRHLVSAFADQGWTVRILTRRDPLLRLWRGVDLEVVLGDLSQPAALRRLCQGCDAVVHGAGLIKARSAEDFHRANAVGARRVAEAFIDTAPARQLVLVSSLAAREPHLSPYAASKRAGEEAVLAVAGDRATIVRPPAIYGSGDRETAGLFRAAAKAPILPILHPDARLCLVHVQDAARQIVALASGDPRPQRPIGLCDDRPDGYSWRELMSAAASAAGGNPKLIRVPESMLLALGAANSAAARVLGGTPMLTLGKAREILHRDWSLSEAERAPDLPPPLYRLDNGFAEAAAAFRRVGET